MLIWSMEQNTVYSFVEVLVTGSMSRWLRIWNAHKLESVACCLCASPLLYSEGCLHRQAREPYTFVSLAEYLSLCLTQNDFVTVAEPVLRMCVYVSGVLQ